MKIDPQGLTEKALKKAFASLTPQSEPNWGKMTSQHMVEHLSDVAMISNGKKKVEVFTALEKLEVYKQKSLFSTTPWPQNVQSPLLEREKLSQLRHGSLWQALDELFFEYEHFHVFFEKKPASMVNNAVFGPLSYQEWCVFHTKHINHHLAQFGLLA